MPIILRTKYIAGLWGGIPERARTPELLRKAQAAYVAQNPAQNHAPEEQAEEKAAYIGNGCWRIHCRCKEATHTDPEWKIACCFGCGAIWRVKFPDDWEAIEKLLVERPVQLHRNWEAPETLIDLIAEQLEHGDRMPEELLK